MRQGGGVGFGDAIGHDDELALLQGLFDFVGIGHADHRIGAHDPYGFDLAVVNGIEQLNGRIAGFPGDVLAAPKAGDPVDFSRIGKIHMRRQLMRQTADFPSTHGVGLSGKRKRPHAGFADSAGRQMAIDDAVDLIRAGRGLVNALAIEAHDFFGVR